MDRKDSFDLEVALTRASIGLGANDQPLGLLHGLPVMRADEIGHGGGERIARGLLWNSRRQG